MAVAISLLATCNVLSDEPDGRVRRQQMIQRVDELLAQRCNEAGLAPAPLAEDDEFLRRAYLDLTGVIPRVADVRAFLDDESPDKRERLVERLLQSPRYATHMANTWRQVMVPGGLDLEQLQNVAGVQNWLRRQFAENMRYDRLVSDFLVATGGGESGPALYYTSLELKPEKLAASTARIFLGLQIECAECHRHPFDHWTQEDFWGYAAFFARLQQSDGRQPMSLQLVDLDVGEVKLPDSDTIVSPRYPGGLSPEAGERGTRRQQLAIWMAARDNPYLAKAAVNRVWAHLFGRGLVEPVDDLGPRNPSSHPELFAELTDYFVQHEFDLQELFRILANTQAYQRSSGAEADSDTPELFATMAIKTLTAEQLYDSLHQVVGGRAAEIPNFFNVSSSLFDQRRLAFAGKMQMRGVSPTEFDAGVLQALTLLNGAEVSTAVGAEESPVLMAIQTPLFTDQERIETLFLGTLSRRPRPDEVLVFLDHIASAKDQQAACGDVLWALLNSAEFMLNH